ncbi:hypothetical protein DMC64_25935 [Amycolatopsis sp. WAC 04197]|uniref:hypothetical protein n=1 Tax=Amycolatopsis sp. WAC 04197 TaxID=2203199 RepID=UPI000F76E208|nr:hypothetical protein [Amycolatopsis sp. WAC 04197]RSN42930.1 hypothetical protein DMC64_25935 [Amycolatopsis sp. WAC 04197]
MHSAESVMGRPKDHRRLPVGQNPRTPKAFGRRPAFFAPHPPLMSGGWYQGDDHEVVGPGRYPVPRPPAKSAKAALLWALFLGPLGLCYVSPVGGLIATAVSITAITFGGAALVAVIWPVVVVLSLAALSGRPDDDRR